MASLKTAPAKAYRTMREKRSLRDGSKMYKRRLVVRRNGNVNTKAEMLKNKMVKRAGETVTPVPVAAIPAPALTLTPVIMKTSRLPRRLLQEKQQVQQQLALKLLVHLLASSIKLRLLTRLLLKRGRLCCPSPLWLRPPLQVVRQLRCEMI